MRTSAPRVSRGSSVRTKSPFLEPTSAPASVPVRSRRSPAPRASSPSIPSRRSSKSPPLAADRDRSSARARLAASMAVRRSWTPLNPSLISWRNWWSGEPSRVGPGAPPAARRPRRSRCPAGTRMRPMAESRLVSSNSSVTNFWRAPRSPRNRSSVRGRRPSPSAKLERRTSSTARAACSLAAVVWATSFSNSRRTTSVSIDVAASWRASRPMRSARSTMAGRSASSRSARAAASAPSTRTSRSTTMRSPSTRTAAGPATDRRGAAEGLGSGRIRASMTRILDPARAT